MLIMERTCIVCGKVFTVIKNFSFTKSCSPQCAMRYWTKNHPNYHHNRSEESKMELFRLLGNKCVVCGYFGIALQLDHINNGGNKERGKIPSYLYWKEILEKVKNGSKEYQILCANCNYEKEMWRRGYVIGTK